MSNAQEFNGFGCTGGDVSPHLKWSNAPIGIRSFTVTVYDPDASIGSDWLAASIDSYPSRSRIELRVILRQSMRQSVVLYHHRAVEQMN